MILILLILLFVLLVPVAIGYFISAPKYNGPKSDHFDGKKFINPAGVQAKGLGDVLKWMRTRKQGAWKEKITTYGMAPSERVNAGVRVTFVNHSTFLIQTDGLNILTDPLWSKRTSPVNWAGPKRMRAPGIQLEDLPPIDVLLLSHNHWDHLDIVTVKLIVEKHRPKIITPLGVKAFLDSEGVKAATDLDWWEEIKVTESMSIQSVPAQHFSGRGMFDRDATLWCGYVIRRPAGNVYFVGDTGYNSTTFKEIGLRCAPIEVAIVPIGAFKPQWFMSPIHCSPEEAVTIHQEIKAKVSIATHFGTFPLADDGQEEPVAELQKALQKAKLNQESFIVLEEGVPHDFESVSST